MAQKTISSRYGKIRLQSTYPPELIEKIGSLTHIAEHKSEIQKELAKRAMLNMDYIGKKQFFKITDEQLLQKMKEIKLLGEVPSTTQKRLVLIELARLRYLDNKVKKHEQRRAI